MICFRRKNEIIGLSLKFVLSMALTMTVFLTFLFLDSSTASADSAKARKIDWSDTSGPTWKSTVLSAQRLDVRKKASVLKITSVLKDDLNSVDSVSICLFELDDRGDLVKGRKLFCTLGTRTKSLAYEGGILETFQFLVKIPKGLASGGYKAMLGDFRDTAGNRRTDISTSKGQEPSLQIIGSRVSAKAKNTETNSQKVNDKFPYVFSELSLSQSEFKPGGTMKLEFKVSTTDINPQPIYCGIDGFINFFEATLIEGVPGNGKFSCVSEIPNKPYEKIYKNGKYPLELYVVYFDGVEKKELRETVGYVNFPW